MTAARVPGVDPAALSEAQRRVWDMIASGPRGDVQGPLRVWLHSPDFADRAQALGAYARYCTSLPPRISELIILVTARIWSAGYEWSSHVPHARTAGVPEAEIAAVGQARMPEFDDPAALAAFDYAVALHRDRQVTPEVHVRAEAAFGRDGVIDLVAICGYYTLISMSIVGFGVPDGGGPALPATDLRPDDMFRS